VAATSLVDRTRSRGRYEYTVIGDPANEAARLTEPAKSLHGRVAASGHAVELARESGSQDGSAQADRWELGRRTRLRSRSQPTRDRGSTSACPIRPPLTSPFPVIVDVPGRRGAR
jgi:class 3 adenylate cyclase